MCWLIRLIVICTQFSPPTIPWCSLSAHSTRLSPPTTPRRREEEIASRRKTAHRIQTVVAWSAGSHHTPPNDCWLFILASKKTETVLCWRRLARAMDLDVRWRQQLERPRSGACSLCTWCTGRDREPFSNFARNLWENSHKKAYWIVEAPSSAPHRSGRAIKKGSAAALIARVFMHQLGQGSGTAERTIARANDHACACSCADQHTYVRSDQLAWHADDLLRVSWLEHKKGKHLHCRRRQSKIVVFTVFTNTPHRRSAYTVESGSDWEGGITFSGCLRCRCCLGTPSSKSTIRPEIFRSISVSPDQLMPHSWSLANCPFCVRRALHSMLALSAKA